MKLNNFLNANNLDWLTDSFDVWIDTNGEIYDMGPDSCHLDIFSLKENINNCSSIEDLIDSGWIKITNTRDKITIEALSNQMKSKRNLLIHIILEKLKINPFNLTINYVDLKEKINLQMPKNQLKFITLL